MMLAYESICEEIGRLFMKETVVSYTEKSLEQILNQALSLLLPNVSLLTTKVLVT
jgi:hypothetical protein